MLNFLQLLMQVDMSVRLDYELHFQDRPTYANVEMKGGKHIH